MRCLYCNKLFTPKRSDTLYCGAKCRVADNRRKKKNGVAVDNSDKTILSLCDYSGNWVKPYRENGYNVVQVDLKHGEDVRLLKLPDVPLYGILAAPPCTCFAVSGNKWIRSDKEMIGALSVVDACLRFVAVAKPVFWALENPIGTLRQYMGKPAFYFNPCDYGDFGEAYTKRTCLWGNFNKPKPRNRSEPVKAAEGYHSLDTFLIEKGVELGAFEQRGTVRSMTPLGFAQAFFEANR